MLSGNYVPLRKSDDDFFTCWKRDALWHDPLFTDFIYELNGKSLYLGFRSINLSVLLFYVDDIMYHNFLTNI